MIEIKSPIIRIKKEWKSNKDTQVRQHPFRVVAPMQPKQEMTKRTTPTPINKYMNLQRHMKQKNNQAVQSSSHQNS